MSNPSGRKKIGLSRDPWLAGHRDSSAGSSVRHQAHLFRPLLGNRPESRRNRLLLVTRPSIRQEIPTSSTVARSNARLPRPSAIGFDPSRLSSPAETSRFAPGSHGSGIDDRFDAPSKPSLPSRVIVRGLRS